MRARIASALVGVTFVVVVADAVVTAQYRSLASEDAVAVHGFPFVSLAALGCAVLGAIMLSQDGRHPIGLLFTLVGVSSAVSVLTESYSLWVVSEGGPGSRGLGGAAGWVSTLLGGQLAVGALALLFLLVPDGHLLSRRWRWAAVVTVLGVSLCTAAVLTENPTAYDLEAISENRGAVASILASSGFLMVCVGMLAAVASIMRRFRRSRGEARQQVRLIAISVALLAGGIVALVVVQIFNGGQQTWASSLPLYLAFMGMPVLFGVAVLRYRLYDIEVILNRTLVLVLGTAFAAIGYTTLVVLVGKQVGSGTSDVWVSLLATALVAVAFQPLRRQVIRLANRLAYGSRAQPYEALWDFSRRIAATPSLETLLPSVADAAGRAVSARGAAAVLHAQGGPVVSAQWGTCGAEADANEVAVRHGREELGRIRVWLSGADRLRRSDVRLLEALAGQTAVVFRNVALQAKLEARVADLDQMTEDLSRSRARIIEADDAARRAMEAAISRDVLPDLVSVSQGISRARRANALGLGTAGLDELVNATNTALEALRDLTRGLFPTQLARSGLEPALRSTLARGGLAGAFHVDARAAGHRFAAPVEAAVYTCSVGAVREFSDVAGIDLSLGEGELEINVRGTRHDEGDLQAIVDRAEAVGGSVSSGRHELVVRIPAQAQHGAPALADGRGPNL